MLIFAPRLDGDVIEAEVAEGIDEGRGKTRISNERNVEVDGGTTYLVAVGQLVGGEVLGDVHHHVDLVLMQEVEGRRHVGGDVCSFGLGGPEHSGVGDAVVGEVLGRAACGVDFVAVVHEHVGGIEHLGFLLGSTC